MSGGIVVNAQALNGLANRLQIIVSDERPIGVVGGNVEDFRIIGAIEHRTEKHLIGKQIITMFGHTIRLTVALRDASAQVQSDGYLGPLAECVVNSQSA